jgi:hypothetical protein
MKATAMMDLKRSLARFTINSREPGQQHSTPFAIKNKYNKQTWALFLHTAWLRSSVN